MNKCATSSREFIVCVQCIPVECARTTAVHTKLATMYSLADIRLFVGFLD